MNAIPMLRAILLAFFFAATSLVVKAQNNLALSFDGVNDYVSVTNQNFNMTGVITIEAWIKVNAFDRPWQAIVTKGDSGWRLQRNSSSNSLAFGTTGSSNVELLGTRNVNDGQWHHVAAVYNVP